MPNSYSKIVEYICPDTKQAFTFEIWLIIDHDERPDLIEKLKAGTLHQVVSPFTNKTLVQLDVPLLIFQPSRSPALFFSLATETTPEEDAQNETMLLEQLKQAVG